MFRKLIYGNSVKKRVAAAQEVYEKEDDEMLYFILLNGISYGRVAIFIDDEHDYKMVIDEIHKYQKKHPEKKVQEGYTAAILSTIELLYGMNSLRMVLSYLDYEFIKLENGTSEFRLDFDTLLNELNNTLESVADVLRAEDKNYDRWIEQRMKHLEERIRKI